MTAGDDFEFDIAITLAGEDRPYVQWVGERLRDSGVRVFYDAFNQAEMWGEDLPVFLDEIFRTRARFALVFVSRHYVEKVWTRHERQSVVARQLQEESAYVLPVKLDDSELPGVHPTRGYIDAREVGRERLIELVLEKLAEQSPIDRVPRTASEEEALLRVRPPGWEYLLFGSVILRRMAELEPKWRDHEMRFKRAAQSLDLFDAHALMSDTFPDVYRMLHNFNRVFEPETLASGFGPPEGPGGTGDADRIRHLGERFIGVYDDLLERAAVLRSAVVPEPLQQAFEVASRFSDQPLREIREFVENTIIELDRLPALMREETDEPLKFRFAIELTMEDGLVEEFSKAMDDFSAYMVELGFGDATQG